jgi:hypothetical protein
MPEDWSDYTPTYRWSRYVDAFNVGGIPLEARAAVLLEFGK